MFKYNRTLPDLGRNFHLDFIGVEQFPVSDVSRVTQLLEGALAKAKLEVACSHHKVSNFGLSMNFILNAGHLNYTSYTEQKACVIDLYFSQIPLEKNQENDKTVEYAFEEALLEVFEFKTQTTNIGFNRGKYTQLQTNEMPNKNEIYHDVKFIHKEKTLFQDLRIYDIKEMGRSLILDGMVQISNELEDNYTVDMQKLIVNEKSENILIIGGGDLLIATYILKHYPNIKKITKCEIDNRVIETVKEFFTYGQNEVKQALESGKLDIVINDGAKFAAEMAAKHQEIYDGIIIDCSDSWNEGSPALSLTTVEFYKNLKTLLKVGGGISQQLSNDDLVPIFNKKWEEAGLHNIQKIKCISPEYGGFLPLGCAYKQ